MSGALLMDDVVVRLYGKRVARGLSSATICNGATYLSSGSNSDNEQSRRIQARKRRNRGCRSASSPTARAWNGRPCARSPRSSVGSAIVALGIRPRDLWGWARGTERRRLRRIRRVEDGADRAVRLGGQAGTSPKIENYLGFPQGISGAELAERAREQAVRFGAEILLHRTGVRGKFLPGRGIGDLDDGTKIVARVSVCATGVEYRRLGLPNEEALFGAGIYYGAGASEAKLCSNEDVVIVDTGNSSAQASLHLARYAREGYYRNAWRPAK